MFLIIIEPYQQLIQNIPKIIRNEICCSLIHTRHLQNKLSNFIFLLMTHLIHCRSCSSYSALNAIINNIKMLCNIR